MVSLRETQENWRDNFLEIVVTISRSIATCNKIMLLKVSVSIDIFQKVQSQMESVKSDSLHT